MAPLSNARHEAFAQHLAKGLSASEAYVKAGYSANEGNCIRLKGNERVAARLAELQAKAAQKAVVTVEDIARQLDEDRAFAVSTGSASAAVSATLGKAKVLGLIVDKAENVNTNYNISDEPLTDAEWAAEHVTEH
jgi:phage terminase small subunit